MADVVADAESLGGRSPAPGVGGSPQLSRLARLWWGLTFSLGVGLSSLLALLATRGACKGDGTFDYEGPGAQPSAYCKLTNFPDMPDTLRSGVVVGAVFLVPMALMLLGSIVSAALDRYAVFRISAIVATVLALVPWILIAFADVGYEGLV